MIQNHEFLFRDFGKVCASGDKSILGKIIMDTVIKKRQVENGYN